MYTYEIDYVATGMWPYRYPGTIEFRSNYEDIEEVIQGAINKIAREGCFSKSSVSIKNVKRLF